MMTLLGKPGPNDIVLFTDTGREHPLTYKFLDDFERNEGIKVHRTAWTKRTGPQNLKGFDSYLYNRTDVPNVNRRECTKELKVKTARRFIRAMKVFKYENYIGFRADEQGRILEYRERYRGVKTVFSLNDLGITKPDVMEFWRGKDYDLEVPPILGNCDLCFLKGKGAIIKIMAMYPELADKWIANETNHTFIKGISYAQMLELSRSFQVTDADLLELTPAFSCSCTA